MSSYGRISNNIVMQIITPPPGFALEDCIHPSLAGRYTAIPDGVDIGAIYDADAGTYTNPDATAVAASEADAAAQLAAAQASKLVAINAAAQDALSALAAGYPDWEVSTWDQQRREAVAVAADNTLVDIPDPKPEGWQDPIPLIRNMATVRISLGVTVSARILALAERIVVNAAAWSTTAGKLIGQRQDLEDAVNTAESPEAVADITIDFGGAA